MLFGIAPVEEDGRILSNIEPFLLATGMFTGDTSVFELNTDNSLVLSDGVEFTFKLFSELFIHGLPSHWSPFMFVVMGFLFGFDSELLLLLPLEFEFKLVELNFISLPISSYFVPILFNNR